MHLAVGNQWGLIGMPMAQVKTIKQEEKCLTTLRSPPPQSAAQRPPHCLHRDRGEIEGAEEGWRKKDGAEIIPGILGGRQQLAWLWRDRIKCGYLVNCPGSCVGSIRGLRWRSRCLPWSERMAQGQHIRAGELNPDNKVHTNMKKEAKQIWKTFAALRLKMTLGHHQFSHSPLQFKSSPSRTLDHFGLLPYTSALVSL